jgi:hypothetical protein
MIRLSARSALALTSVALVLSACGSSSAGKGSTAAAVSTPTTTASASSAASTSATLSGGTNATGPFCGQLKTSQTTLAGQSSQYVKAITAGNFPGIKAALSAFFHKAEGELATVESSMTGVPSNVQDALTTVNKTYGAMVSAVDNSTSLPELSAAFIALSKNPALRPAMATLTAYGQSQCVG